MLSHLIVGNAPSNFDCSRMKKRGLPGYRGIGDTWIPMRKNSF